MPLPLTPLPSTLLPPVQLGLDYSEMCFRVTLLLQLGVYELGCDAWPCAWTLVPGLARD